MPKPPRRRTVRPWQCSWEPAGAVRLVPPLGLIIYVSASGPRRTWQGLPAVFGNTLCRAPAGPALLPAAGAARQDARAVFGVWVAGAPRFPYPARSHEPPSAPTHLSSVSPSPGRAVLLAHELGLGHTARNLEVQKDAVAHFKTKPNY